MLLKEWLEMKNSQIGKKLRRYDYMETAEPWAGFSARVWIR
jgi:hypothetical protein